MVGWHHRLDAHESGQAPGVGDGQGSLAFCSPLGCKELDTTEQLNCTEKVKISLLKISEGVTLCPPSDVCVRSFLCLFSYFNKTLLHKSS